MENLKKAVRILAANSALQPSERKRIDILLGDDKPTQNVRVTVAEAPPESPLKKRRPRRSRSAVSGQIVSAETAAANPATTVTEN